MDLWKMVADLFNDPKNVYWTEALPELHSAFAEPIELRFEDMPGPITAEQAKNRFSDGRGCLIQVRLLKFIQ